MNKSLVSTTAKFFSRSHFCNFKIILTDDQAFFKNSNSASDEVWPKLGLYDSCPNFDNNHNKLFLGS